MNWENKQNIEPGNTVVAKLYDARTVVGQVCVGGVYLSTSGYKVRIKSGDAVYLVNIDRVLKKDT